MDMQYSLPCHGDPLTMVQIVDEAWANMALPKDDIPLPPTAHLEDDDTNAQNDNEDENKWTDLALEGTTSNPTPNTGDQHDAARLSSQAHADASRIR